MATIERLKPDQWQRLRDMRLRLLEADPDSFGSTLEREQNYSAEQWAGRSGNPNVATFLATENGIDYGISAGGPYRSHSRDCAGMYSVWVDPRMRGRGLGEQLIHAVISWAKEAGFDELCLEVGDHNTAAITLYERCGFLPTGNTLALDPPRDHITEHERRLDLRAAPNRPDPILNR